MPVPRRRDRTNSLRYGAVGSLLTDHLDRLGFGVKVRQHMAPLVWAEAVGPQIAAATEVEKVRDGVLFVTTRSAMWASELTFYKVELLRRLNEKVGAPPQSPVLTDIRFHNRGLHKKREGQVVPVPRHPTADELADVDLSAREIAAIDASLARISDEGLRERLRRLRMTDTRLRTWRLDNGWAPCPTCGELAPPRSNDSTERDCARCRIARYNAPPLPLPDENPFSEVDRLYFADDGLPDDDALFSGGDVDDP